MEEEETRRESDGEAAPKGSGPEDALREGPAVASEGQALVHASQPFGTKLALFGLGIAAVFFVILSGWQMASRVSERRQAEAALERSRGEGLKLAVEAAAASVQPMVTLRGQAPEITDRTFQSVCEGILRADVYDLVAITDASGTVLASSNLALVGRPFEGVRMDQSELKKVKTGVAGETWQASAPIRANGANLGVVILRDRPR